MPGEFSTVAAQYALDYTSGRAVVLAARTTYLALLTSVPSDGTTLATMSEVSTAGYARQPVTWTAPSSASPSVTSNTANVTFGPFTVAMASAATHCALVSALTGTTGDFIWWWMLDFAKTAAINESIQFTISTLTMSLS